MNAQEMIAAAQAVFDSEIRGLHAVSQALGDEFAQAVDLMLTCRGRVIVTGMGKSGHIGHKIAATLASTGTPAFFVHPAEAAHGDLGMILADDVVLALSYSGESDEMLAILPALKRKNTALIAMTGRKDSTLARQANVHLNSHIPEEACPMGLAPTTSTTAALALGDALAVTLLQARRFTPNDFALSHPAGSLGKSLLVRVGDLMHTNDALPVVADTASLREAIVEMSQKGMGFTGVTDASGCLKGIFTDGDLRRLFEQNRPLEGIGIHTVMHPAPRTIEPDQLASQALHVMQSERINGLLVTEHGKLVGAINMHDLLRAGIV